MTTTPSVWDRVLTRAAAARGMPMLAAPGHLHDAGFQRCLMRLRSAGACLQMHAGAGARHGAGVLLLGEPQHTLPACACLGLAGFQGQSSIAGLPQRPLRCLALVARSATNLEMNSWLEAAQAGMMAVWHQMLFTNDTLRLEIVRGPATAAGRGFSLSWGDTTATLTVGL